MPIDVAGGKGGPAGSKPTDKTRLSLPVSAADGVLVGRRPYAGLKPGARPDAGDGGVAVGALPFFEPILQDVVPGATDEKFFTVWAVGVGGFGEDIAFVNIMEADIESDLSGLVDRRGGSGRLILQFEIGMEGGEV